MTSSSSKTVVVIGGSYAGFHAAELLAQHLLPTTHHHHHHHHQYSIKLIERNSHFNNVYSFPRTAVIGQPQRNFIPYQHKIQRLIQNSSSNSSRRHPNLELIQASVTRITDGKVFIDRFSHQPPTTTINQEDDSGYGSANESTNHQHQPIKRVKSIEDLASDTSHTRKPSNQIAWDFLIYALGSHMPAPLRLPNHSSSRTKQAGVRFLEAQRQRISDAQKIVIVGGGALGIQYACDIAHHYQRLGRPKEVTLIHSRSTFLATFKPEIDGKVKQALARFGVHVVLGQRVNLVKLDIDLTLQANSKTYPPPPVFVQAMSCDQKQWQADLVLVCTGQVPNTSLMAQFCPLAVQGGLSGASGLIRVNRALQLAPSIVGPSPVETPRGEVTACECSSKIPIEGKEIMKGSWKRVFAIGDCIDGFGAIKAGHVGWNQAEVAVRNLLHLIHASNGDLEAAAKIPEEQLEAYVPSPPMIKLTLGLDRTVCQLRSESNPDETEVTEKVIDVEELEKDPSWMNIWKRFEVPSEAMADGWA